LGFCCLSVGFIMFYFFLNKFSCLAVFSVIMSCVSFAMNHDKQHLGAAVNRPLKIHAVEILACPVCGKILLKNSMEHLKHGEVCSNEPDRQSGVALAHCGITYTRREQDATYQHRDTRLTSTADSGQNSSNYLHFIPEQDATYQHRDTRLTSTADSGQNSSNHLPFTCKWRANGDHCNQIFSNQDELVSHLQNCHGRTCPWLGCGEGPYINHEALMNHIEKVHVGNN
jgi:hypothetical protein